jgi:hypothetical protein
MDARLSRVVWKMRMGTALKGNVGKVKNFTVTHDGLMAL